MVDKRAALKATRLFGDLTAAATKELAAFARVQILGRGEVLFLAGDKAAGLFVIVSGQIRAYRVNSQGREQTIHVEHEGATLAEVPVFDDGTYPATAVAEEPTTLLFLEKNEVRRFMLKHSDVCLTALKLMAERLRAHADLVDAVALQQVGQRLARFLLTQARDHGSRLESGLEVELSLSNEDLAKRVGSVREVVSRTLTRMEGIGLIAQVPGQQHGKPRRVLIVNEAGLTRYAGEERSR